MGKLDLVCHEFKSQSQAKTPETSSAEQTCQYRESEFAQAQPVTLTS